MKQYYVKNLKSGWLSQPYATKRDAKKALADEIEYVINDAIYRAGDGLCGNDFHTKKRFGTYYVMTENYVWAKFRIIKKEVKENAEVH